MLLSRKWNKCLRGQFSTNIKKIWLLWKGLNNQIKIDVDPKLKMMIIEYNAPNEVLFNQSDLGSYQVMTFKWGDISKDIPIGGLQELFPNDEALQEFMDNIVSTI